MRKTTRIKIGLHPARLSLQLGWHSPPSSYAENNYWVEAIEDGDKFYYRAKGTTIEIADWEFDRVIINPTLYYFSTALRLHIRIKREMEGVYDD